MSFKRLKLSIPKPILILTIIALLIGVGLRIGAFFWNTQLQGDINLFALTAREFIENNRLFYPAKYEFSDYVPYLTLSSPASQHPPLWPLLTGVIGKLFHTQNTFLILKILSEIGGLLLFFSILFFGKRTNMRLTAAIAVMLVALSPTLIDFSANGSPYIFSAALLVITSGLFSTFPKNKKIGYALGGIIVGIGMLTHSIMVCLLPAFFIFWLLKSKGNYIRQWKNLIIFGLVFFITLLPWLMWNFAHFGKPLYSYSTFHLLKKLGIAKMGIFQNSVTTQIVAPVDFNILQKYLFLMKREASLFFIDYLFELGPFVIILSAIGAVKTLKSRWENSFALFVPTALYLITVVLWATFRHRFIVPALPAAYILAAIGFTWLYNQKRLRLLGSGFLIAAAFWSMAIFFQFPLTRYYLNDLSHYNQYAQMLPLAKKIDKLPPGAVLGYAKALDGGFETVYWHHQPFVYAREFDDEITIEKLVKDFNIRYIWTDNANLNKTQMIFPYAKIILQNPPFYILELQEVN